MLYYKAFWSKRRPCMATTQTGSYLKPKKRSRCCQWLGAALPSNYLWPKALIPGILHSRGCHLSQEEGASGFTGVWWCLDNTSEESCHATSASALIRICFKDLTRSSSQFLHNYLARFLFTYHQPAEEWGELLTDAASGHILEVGLALVHVRALKDTDNTLKLCLMQEHGWDQRKLKLHVRNWASWAITKSQEQAQSQEFFQV